MNNIKCVIDGDEPIGKTTCLKFIMKYNKNTTHKEKSITYEEKMLNNENYFTLSPLIIHDDKYIIKIIDDRETFKNILYSIIPINVETILKYSPINSNEKIKVIIKYFKPIHP
jgi:hypothetical protein